MSEPVTATTSAVPLRDCAAGFYGKIPSRGDFVRSGLPRVFVDPWDRWMQRGIVASRAVLGDEWGVAWLEAAIWSFALAPGVCGPGAVLGLWMPSVDRAGRYFPLTLAAVVPGGDVASLACHSGGFLAAVEAAGLAALENDILPDDLAERAVAATAVAPLPPRIDPERYPGAGALWWTEGAPRVPRGVIAGLELPDARAFVTMLDARYGIDPT